MMGIIVNAGKVLKYGSLIFLVVLYSYKFYKKLHLAKTGLKIFVFVIP